MYLGREKKMAIKVRQTNKLTPNQKANLSKLHTIPYGKIKSLPAFGTSIPMDLLNAKDKARTIYLLNTSLIKGQEDFNKMMQEYTELGLAWEAIQKHIMKNPQNYDKELIALIDV